MYNYLMILCFDVYTCINYCNDSKKNVLYNKYVQKK